MNLDFDAVYYEPATLEYPLGNMLSHKYGDLPWIPVESHNRIPELSAAENREFPMLKRHLILGVRKTHSYTQNNKVSDFLVPYTSSGCRAMCLYCYLVCHYNKCSYLRVFVNREQMMERLLKKDRATSELCTFELGSNSDLVLENVVTNNLPWTIETFGREGRGRITFPTKFDMVEPLLNLDHRGKTIFRMSVNPEEVIRKIELGTSPLLTRIKALNRMAEAGYPVGLLIAPVILLPGWKELYCQLIELLCVELSDQVKREGFLEIILMTYSFVHNAINSEAFPGLVPLLDREKMTGRGRGKYCYRAEYREEAETFFRTMLEDKLPTMKLLYIS